MSDLEIIEKNRSLMEDIWSYIPKETNLPSGLKGEYIRYIKTDPLYLYSIGFVDERTYKIEEWESAFLPFKQEDETYLISKEQFISLGKYKYTGPIKKPLDAMEIREGWYEIEKWRAFAIKSVFPSTTLDPEIWVKGEKLLREAGKIINNRIYVDKMTKLRVKELLDKHPSISRMRELGVYSAHKKRIETEAARNAKPTESSTYIQGAKAGTKEKKNLNEALMKTSQLGQKSQNTAETFSLKDIRKKSIAPKKQGI